MWEQPINEPEDDDFDQDAWDDYQQSLEDLAMEEGNK